ncbi:MAG: DUF2231 domain-containing protein [Acidobacteriota bacterium]
MQELLSGSSLPNLHPLSVHFPIALLPVAILFDLCGLVLQRHPWLERAAPLLYGLAAAGAWVAEWAGERATESLADVPQATEALIARHSDLAHTTVWAMAVLAVLRLSVTLFDGATLRRVLRGIVLLLGLATLGLLLYVADLGGALVYRHAVAVDPVALDLASGRPEGEDGISPPRDRVMEQE